MKRRKIRKKTRRRQTTTQKTKHDNEIMIRKGTKIVKNGASIQLNAPIMLLKIETQITQTKKTSDKTFCFPSTRVVKDRIKRMKKVLHIVQHLTESRASETGSLEV